MKNSSYHSLLPAYLQDRLKESVNTSLDEARFSDVDYMAKIDDVIEKVRQSYPKAFRGVYGDHIR